HEAKNPGLTIPRLHAVLAVNAKGLAFRKGFPGIDRRRTVGHELQRILWLLEDALLKGEPSENFLGSCLPKAWA
ncbi:MAG: hypothetical protein AAEJ57_06905, partial [Opitutales bacterium]